MSDTPYHYERLNDVQSFLKNYIHQNPEIVNNNGIISNCSSYYNIIKDSSFSCFAHQVNNSFLIGDDFFNCLSLIWPKKEIITAQKKINQNIGLAIDEFEKDFFREKHPIFEFIIKNNTEDEIVIDKAIFEMKNISVDMTPRSYGGSPLAIAIEYEWTLTNLKDKSFNDWFNKSDNEYPLGFKSNYKPIIASSLKLDTPIKISSKSNIRFIVKISDGYR